VSPIVSHVCHRFEPDLFLSDHKSIVKEHCSRGKCLQKNTVAEKMPPTNNAYNDPIYDCVFEAKQKWSTSVRHSFSRAPPRQALVHLPVAAVSRFIIATTGKGEADGALEQLMHPSGRWDKWPCPGTVNLPSVSGNRSLPHAGAGPQRRHSSSKVGRGAAPDDEGNWEGEGNGMEWNGDCGGGWCWVSSRRRE
jgi:hypothetical protein